MVITRRLEALVSHSLVRTAAVLIIGPKQVGKTTLALDIASHTPSIYLDLESRLDKTKVSDITAFYQGNDNKLIILDEVQRMPGIFTEIRGIIDQERRKGNKTGRFLFLGSASIELLKQSSESLAGRITIVELRPVDLLELGGSQQNRLWLRGGFPESLLADNDTDSLLWRTDFIRTYLERDIPQLGPRIAAQTLERFWIMLAHRQGSLLNAAQLAQNLEVSGVTISRYIDLMSDLLLVRRLPPWKGNAGKRLIKAPRIFVRDSGITHALLNISSFNDLLSHPVVGSSWEGFVIENLLAVAPPRTRPFFYRTAGGAEIDLILEFSTLEKWAIEIKRNSAPSLSKGFYLACDEIRPSRRLVVYAGSDSFPMAKGVEVISLAGLMTELLHAA